MGQAGSVEQKSAIREVLALRRPGVGKTELEEALRAFCALFPLELPVEADAVGSTIGVDVKERRLFDVVHALLREQTELSQRRANEDELLLLLTSFRRVIRWRELYKLCAKCSLKPFLSCLYRPSPPLVLSVLATLELMMAPCPGAEAGDKAAERCEAANRRNFGGSGGFDVLRALLVQYGAVVVQQQDADDAAAVLAGVLQLFHVTLVSRRGATDLLTCSQAVAALLNARVSLLDLCHCWESRHGIMKTATGLVKELFCIVDLEQVHELQESAREYGALLYALATAVQEEEEPTTTVESEGETLQGAEEDDELREMCVDLVELFCAGNTRSKKAMYRIFPVELFIPAESRAELISRHTAASPSSLAQSKTVVGMRSARTLPHFSFDFEQPRRASLSPGSASGSNGNADTKLSRVVALAHNARNVGNGAFERWLDDAREQGEHWRDIVEAVRHTHERPELVWRAAMRAELRQALQAEIESLERRRHSALEDEDSAAGGPIARWDHEMFYVEYPSMHAELMVNGYFVEYLIPCVADLTTTYEIAEPVVLAWHLSDQLAVERDARWALLCVRCLRLVIRRYAMLFHGQLPTRHVLALLHDHTNHPPVFVSECFLLLNTAIVTTRNAPSESFNRLCTTVARAVVDVLADPVLLATLSAPHMEDETENDDDEELMQLADPEEETVLVINERDALVRAGISLLLAVVRRAKFALRHVRPKRVFICRLLAVETLDHVTITRLLFVLKQLALLDSSGSFGTASGAGGSSSRLSSVSSSSLSSSFASYSGSAKDANWKSLALVYVLLASCDPKGMGMCVAAAEFLKENYALPPLARRAGALKGSHSAASSSEFNDLLSDALGFGGCGMGRLLESASAEVFTEVFNAHQKRAADVNWGRTQRVRLYRYLKHKYVGSGDKIHPPPDAKASRSSYAASANGSSEDHHYEDDDLFVGNIFLRSYIEGDGAFLNEWTSEMYSDLINALFEQLVLLGRKKSALVGSGGAVPSPSPPASAKASAKSSGPCAAEPWEVQVLILKALARLVPSHCANVEIKTEFYESLLAPLHRSMLGEIDQVRGILSLELFVAVLSVPEARSVNTAACRLFLEEKGLSVLAEALGRMRSPAYQQLLSTVELSKPRGRGGGQNTQNMARVLLYRSTDVLSTLAAQQAAGIRAIIKNPDVVTALLELASRKIIMQYADIDAATVCLSCLGGLCHYDELRKLVVAAGGLLSLVDTVAFCPAEELNKVSPTTAAAKDTDIRDDADTADDDEDEEGDRRSSSHSNSTSKRSTNGGGTVEDLQRTPSRFFGAIRSAALALRACLDDKKATSPSLPTLVLHQLLTPSFVRVLRASPDSFILQLQSIEDTDTPTLVWTVSMRQRLQECIMTELAKVKAAGAANSWPRWDPEHFVAADSFRYQYPELADVLILDDVYLANFVATPGEDVDLGDIDMASFSETLLISIQSHENVLRILQQRGASDPAKEAAIRLMRQAMDKLVGAHPQHNLEVTTPQNAPLSDSSLATTSTPASIFSSDLFAPGNASSPTDDRDWDVTRFERFSSTGIEDLTV